MNTTPFKPASHQVPISSESSREILETPAYLTPAINTFFDSLIDTFLKKRVSEVEAQPLGALQMEIDEDDEMEVDQPQTMAIASTRTVTASEMNDLVGLFRTYVIQGQFGATISVMLTSYLVYRSNAIITRYKTN